MEENKPAESKEAVLKATYDRYRTEVIPDENWADWEQCKNDGTVAMVLEAMESYSAILRKERDASEANLQTALDKYEQLQQTLDEREKEISVLKERCIDWAEINDDERRKKEDLQHQLTQLTTSNEELQQQHTESLLLYQNMCDQITKDQKQLEEVRKERDYYKALAEGYKKLLKRYEDDKQKNQ